MENLKFFTFIPTWIIQDLMVFIATLLWMFFIIKTEKNPIRYFLELVCFIFCYAAVYENLATVMGLYGFGRSLVMIFNVPITVPLVEYLVVYTSLRLISYTKMPVWAMPFFVGFMGMLFDFTLDPLAIRQVYETNEGTIGRWSWYIGQHDVHILNVPVYNFSGWIILCGYAAAFILLGRRWYALSNRKTIIQYLYPPLCMLAALLVMVSPLSQFMLWLAPVFTKGSYGEWIMLLVWFIAPLILFIIYGRKFTRPLSLKGDYLIFLVLIGFHLVNIVFALTGKHYDVLILQIGITLFQTLIILFIYYGSNKKIA